MRIRYIIGPDATVASDDRGLAYGDGLFETMAVGTGRVRRLRLHLDRLKSGCERLSLPLPDERELSSRLAGLAAGIGTGALKLVLTRGSGPRGYAPPAEPAPVVILTPLPQAPAPVTALTMATLSQRLGENENLAGIKHLCRLEQVLGQLELKALNADEGLMLSTGGNVIGGTSRNLFAVFGGRLVTPALSRAGISGVMRRAVLEQCAALGIDAREADLRREDLDTADGLFMTNALVGIQTVSRFDGRALSAPALASRLRAALGLRDDG